MLPQDVALKIGFPKVQNTTHSDCRTLLYLGPTGHCLRKRNRVGSLKGIPDVASHLELLICS